MILRWAREPAGLSVEDAADKIGIGDARGIAGSDRLAMLEDGQIEPTRSQLIKMSTQYRRPLLTFYLAEPPATAPRGEEFRTLPDEYARRDAALVDTLLREAPARQEMVRALLESEEEAEPLDFVASYDIRRGGEGLATAISERLGFSLQSFRSGKGRGTPKGFAYLRERAEAARIFVLLIGNLGSHHSDLNVELFRGPSAARSYPPPKGALPPPRKRTFIRQSNILSESMRIDGQSLATSKPLRRGRKSIPVQPAGSQPKSKALAPKPRS